jgi:murein DD-endopeptidase MepM/ murein hydrolase activator NlpD
MPAKTFLAARLLVCAAIVFPFAANAQRLSISPARPQPGAVVTLALTATNQTDPISSVRGTLAGEPLHFAGSGAAWRAIGGVPVDATGALTATAVVRRVSGKTDTVRARVVLPRQPPPPSQPLAVDNRFTQPLDAATEARIARENARARDIGKRSHESAPMWRSTFLRPRSSVVTSSFGSGRLFNGQLTARHLGVDFRGALGEPVRASNRGVVALVGDFFLAGNVVYINHGGGVVTAYFHLSKTLVSEGDTVSRGQQIGLVGNTGRVTGPHLHWAARYGEITVNPLDLVKVGRSYSTSGAGAY